jgi:pilus assembly protein Flp/PilA
MEPCQTRPLLAYPDLALSWALTWVRSRSEAGDETGATAVEYAIVVFLIAAVIVVMVALLGQQVVGAFQSTCNAVKSVVAGASGC